MNVGDLVRFDSPGGPSSRVGLIVDKTTVTDGHFGEYKRLEYQVMFAGVIWRCAYEDLLAEEDWVDAAR